MIKRRIKNNSSRPKFDVDDILNLDGWKMPSKKLGLRTLAGSHYKWKYWLTQEFISHLDEISAN